jgi:hypothetical protein
MFTLRNIDIKFLQAEGVKWLEAVDFVMWLSTFFNTKAFFVFAVKFRLLFCRGRWPHQVPL